MEHKYKVSERGPKRRYYIREIGITVISGLGRFGGGGGLARDFYRQNLVVHLGLGRASWQGTQGLPPSFRRPLWPSSRAGFAPIPTKSGASRASGLICGSRERRRPGPAHRGPGRTRAGGGRAGELVDQGQRRPRAGHCRRLWERLWGRRLELGPTKSGASRASGLICGSRERRSRPGPAHRGPGRTRAGGGRAGELVDQGQRRPRAGHCRRLWERLWGSASRTGREHLQGSR